MRELPEDLTNSLRSFRGSIYGRGQTRQEDQNARTDDVDLEKGSEDYGDKEFERAFNTSQSTLDMQSATSAQHVDQVPSPRQDGNIDLEKQEQNLRFEDAEHEEEEESEQPEYRRGPGRPRVDTSVDMGKNRPRRTPDTPGKRSILHGAHVKDLDPASDRLADDPTPLTAEDFYELMGMNPASLVTDGRKQVLRPHGLYTKIVRSTTNMNTKYRAFAVSVYVLLVLQLIISAVFIILGSLDKRIDTHITIAILGAVSTVIAGGLALMQGQGLPFRLRKTRDELRNVVFAAEELYDDMRTGREILYQDIKKIREDYLRVLEDQRNNQPDMWNQASRSSEQGASRPGGRGK